jgi:hypothetical protein
MINKYDIPLLYDFCKTVEQMIDSMTDLELLQFMNECETASKENCWWIAHRLSSAIMPIAANTLQLHFEKNESES